MIQSVVWRRATAPRYRAAIIRNSTPTGRVSVVYRDIDLLRHDGRIGFVARNPLRNERLDMPLKTRDCVFNNAPSGPAFSMKIFISGVNVSVREIIGMHVCRTLHHNVPA